MVSDSKNVFSEVQNCFLPSLINFGLVQILLDKTKIYSILNYVFDPCLNNLIQQKKFSTDQNSFGHIEGQGLICLIYFFSV